MFSQSTYSITTLLAVSSLLFLQSTPVLADSSTESHSSAGTLTTRTVSSSGTRTASHSASGTVTSFDYCITDPPKPSFAQRTGSTDVIPPIPCTAGYFVQQGICCKADDEDNCTGTDLVWSLPLASCVTVNPQWNGCPGNMLGGVCCDGPGVGFEGNGTGKATQVQCDGKTVFVVTTSGSSTVTISGSDFVSTSMLPLVTVGQSTAASTTSGGSVVSTSSKPAAAGPTAVLEVAKLVVVGIAGAAALL